MSCGEKQNQNQDVCARYERGLRSCETCICPVGLGGSMQKPGACVDRQPLNMCGKFQLWNFPGSGQKVMPKMKKNSHFGLDILEGTIIIHDIAGGHIGDCGQCCCFRP